jgi:hypothetical protein
MFNVLTAAESSGQGACPQVEALLLHTIRNDICECSVASTYSRSSVWSSEGSFEALQTLREGCSTAHAPLECCTRQEQGSSLCQNLCYEKTERVMQAVGCYVA